MFTSRQSSERHSDSKLQPKQLGAATLLKSTLISRFRAGVLVVLAALTISVRFGYATVPEEKGPTYLNKHQLKTLRKRAHTADDFCLLSKSYAQESARLERKAREHQEEADGYASGRVFEPKNSDSGRSSCTLSLSFVWSHLTSGDPAYTLVQVSVNDLIMLLLLSRPGPAKSLTACAVRAIEPWQSPAKRWTQESAPSNA